MSEKTRSEERKNPKSASARSEERVHEFVPFCSSLMRSPLFDLFVFRSSLMRSTLLELPCSLQAILVKIALGETVAEFVVIPNQGCAFAGLVVDHVHFVGPPIFVEILLITF